MNEGALNSRTMRYFIHMMLSRTFAEAAEKLDVTEAAVGKVRRALELEIGAPLFQRVQGRLRPTSLAHKLLPFVQRSLRHIEAAQEMAHRLSGRSDDRIIVTIGGPALVSLVPRAIEPLKREFPDTYIEIQIDSTKAAIENVVSNVADIGIGPPPSPEIDGRTLEMCNIRDIVRSEMVAVMPRNHRLSRLRQIRPSDIENERLIGLPDYSTTTELVEAAFLKTRLAPKNSIVVANAVGICCLVRSGLGIALINPLTVSSGMFPDLVSVPFRPRTVLRTCLYTSKIGGSPPPANRFIEHIVSIGKHLSG